MGFVNFFKLVAGSFDVLPWPIITLIYPLYASVKAIESNSQIANRKWLTYWVLCGLIMVFENTSSRLIDWIPFWPHIKLMVTFWFVIPHFDGALYAYDHFVRPCFSVNPHVFGSWFRPNQDEFSKINSDDFLVHAKRFVEENGTEGLENLIYNKVNCIEPKLAIGESNSIASVVNKEAGILKRVNCIEPKLAIGESNSIASVVNIEAGTLERVNYIEPKLAIGESNSIASVVNKEVGTMERIKLVDCTLAQTEHEVIAPTKDKVNYIEPKLAIGESNSIASVVNKEAGTMERVNCIEPKLAIGESNSIAFVVNKEAGTLERVNCIEPKLAIGESNSIASVVNKEAGTLERIKLMDCTLAQTEHKVIAPTKDKVLVVGSELPQSPNPTGVKEWTCALCHVWTHNEIILQAHFQGKKHKAKEKELKESTLTATDYKGVDVAENNLKVGAGVIAGVGERPRLFTPDKTQEEWICPLCQVCTSSKVTLKNHFYGKKHMDKEMELAAKHMAAKNKTASASNSKTTDNPKVVLKESLLHVMEPEEKRVGGTVTPKEGLLGKHVNNSEGKRAEGAGTGDQQTRTNQSNMKPQIGLSELWCDKCKLQCNSLSMLTDHLRGKRHLGIPTQVTSAERSERDFPRRRVNKNLTNDDLQHVYSEFQTLSHGDQDLHLPDSPVKAVSVPENILNIKREIDAELGGEDQSWGRGDANVQTQSQIRYSEPDNRDWRGRSSQLPASGEDRSWGDNKQQESYQSNRHDLNSQFSRTQISSSQGVI